MKKFKIKKEEFDELEEMGYGVHGFSPWHFRVSKEEGEFSLDIYPTRKSYCVKYAEYTTKSKKYENLIDLVETLLP